LGARARHPAKIEITAVALMGGIDVIVSNGVEVDLSDFAVMGAN